MAKANEQLTLKVMLPPCRMSFPKLFEPEDTDGGPRYKANFLYPPGTDFKKFEDALYDVFEEMFGKDEKKWPRGRNDRTPDMVVRDCTEKDYEGYKAGWRFIVAGSKDPVGIVDAQRNHVTNPREVYGGRWCRISVTVRAYDNKSKGVGVYLNSVQLLDHDEQFGGRGPAKNDFEDWDGDPLSKDDRGTGTGTSVADDEDDRPRRTRGDDDRQGRDRGREDRRSDPRDGDRDDRGTRDARGRGRPADDDADAGRGSRRGDDDDRGSRDRGSRDRDDDRRGRSARDEDDRPARGRRDPEPEPEDEPRPSRSRRPDPEDDDRPSRRSRDDDRDAPRSRSREDWN